MTDSIIPWGQLSRMGGGGRAEDDFQVRKTAFQHSFAAVLR